MKKTDIPEVILRLREATRNFELPLIDQLMKQFGKDSFIILIGCLLSLRVKDIVTIHVCRDLFSRVRTPQELLQIERADLEKIVFKTGFFRNKARVLHEVSRELLDRFDGRVPDTLEELRSLKGVGLKTANLVLGLAFDKPAICVDTHVHRISNRLGLIKTKTVEETETTLKKVLPQNYWIEWNKLLVMYGQNLCVPISPKCSHCSIRDYCDRIGVVKSR